MRFLMILAGCLICAFPTYAEPSITGTWLTRDRTGVIAVTRCKDALCGRIVGFFMDRPSDPTPVNYRGVSQCQLALFTDARLVRPNLWKGHITDPRNGSSYGVELSLNSHGNLALRGFIGIPLLGQTETWTRYDGRLPDDCRIMDPGDRQASDRNASAEAAASHRR